MPYVVRKRKGKKCVYKKKKNGKPGEKVGCTKKSIKKYLAALHINANEGLEEVNEVKRQNKILDISEQEEEEASDNVDKFFKYGSDKVLPFAIASYIRDLSDKTPTDFWSEILKNSLSDPTLSTNVFDNYKSAMGAVMDLNQGRPPPDINIDKMREMIKKFAKEKFGDEYDEEKFNQIVTVQILKKASEMSQYLSKNDKDNLGENKMKIKPSRLREIIQEEVSDFNSRMSAPPDDITGEPDDEGAMARSQLLKLAKYSDALMGMMNDNTQLPAWVQAKITKSASYLGAVKHFIEGEVELNEAVDGDPMSENAQVDPEQQMDEESWEKVAEQQMDESWEKVKALVKEYGFRMIEYHINQMATMHDEDIFGQEEEPGLNEEKQQMKISKQKLERIIREEVLKEMGMNENENDDPILFIPNGFIEELKKNESIKNSSFDPELEKMDLRDPESGPSPMKVFLDNLDKNKAGEVAYMPSETRQHMIDQLSDLINEQEIDEKAEKLLLTFLTPLEKQESSGVNESLDLNEEKQQMRKVTVEGKTYKVKK